MKLKQYALIMALAVASWSAAAEGATIFVTLAPGAAYTHKVKFGLVSMKLTPQIAMWIETEDGHYVDTIFVTHKAAADDWRAAGGSRRPESLPLWSHARGIAMTDGGYMPDAAHRLPDAISGATPEAGFTKSWAVPAALLAALSPGQYRVRVELNSSFDWNADYPDKLPKSDPRWTAANGQPSILWEGSLTIGGDASKVSLKPIGTGSLRGDSGALTPSLAGLTSAKDLASSITAEYRP